MMVESHHPPIKFRGTKTHICLLARKSLGLGLSLLRITSNRVERSSVFLRTHQRNPEPVSALDEIGVGKKFGTDG